VGEISFWAPNRGLLITGGTQSEGGAVPGGLYAYDGASWHELASVCGGALGRIAWAGPDEFWTISAQRSGQTTSSQETTGELEALSLCHFQGDQVIGSYAMPLGEPSSYRKMDAAACLSPSDCWFAGEDGQPPNDGSFHLHWNGSELQTSYDPADHAVAGMASFDGRFYEGLTIGAQDTDLSEEYLPAEEELGGPPLAAPKHPPVIRTIAAAEQTQSCDGTAAIFCNEFLFSGQPLPVYSEGAAPDALGGFDVATDGGPLGAGATQLWAGADPLGRPPDGSAPAKVTILHGNLEGSWTQVLPTTGGTTPLGEAELHASEVNEFTEQETFAGSSIAPVPGTESAWLSLGSGPGEARVALLEADGSLAATDELPEAGEDVGPRGEAGPIACPGLSDCWMATTEGWLFHLQGGAPVAPNADPLFDGQDGVISFRPPDAGVPAVYPDGFAEDDSLANQQAAPALAPPAETPPPSKPTKAKKAKPLVKDVKSVFLRHRTLVITFTLTARAHVQLIARKRKYIVARTRRELLRAGVHSLSLGLNPAQWPTRLSFEAEPIAASPAAPGASGGSEAGDTVET
jgi:hypothetical protein